VSAYIVFSFTILAEVVAGKLSPDNSVKAELADPFRVRGKTLKINHTLHSNLLKEFCLRLVSGE
jgi:hypothetical protein